eukprot:3101712-Amphidinium_carterae.2
MVAAVTAMRFSDTFYAQWCVLNIPFRSFVDLHFEELRLVPEHFHGFAMALHHRSSLWRDLEAVQADLQRDALADHIIRSNLAMIEAHIAIVDGYWSGELVLGVDATPMRRLPEGASLPPGLEQEQWMVVDRINNRVQEALQQRQDQDDRQDWASAPWFKSSQAMAVLGPAGSGKSTAVQVAVHKAIESNANVVIACPTRMLVARTTYMNALLNLLIAMTMKARTFLGMDNTTRKGNADANERGSKGGILSRENSCSRIREKFPHYDVDSIHATFELFKPEHQTLDAMQQLDLVIVEEVSQVSQETFERLLRLWDAAQRRPVLVFVGDFAQLKGVDPTTARDSLRWTTHVNKLYLHTMRRCKCPVLKWKLQLLRGHKPNKHQLGKILTGHKAPSQQYRSSFHMPQVPTENDIGWIFRENPETTCVCISRHATSWVNTVALQQIFSNMIPLTTVRADPEGRPHIYPCLGTGCRSV